MVRASPGCCAPPAQPAAVSSSNSGSGAVDLSARYSGTGVSSSQSAAESLDAGALDCQGCCFSTVPGACTCGVCLNGGIVTGVRMIGPGNICCPGTMTPCSRSVNILTENEQLPKTAEGARKSAHPLFYPLRVSTDGQSAPVPRSRRRGRTVCRSGKRFDSPGTALEAAGRSFRDSGRAGMGAD